MSEKKQEETEVTVKGEIKVPFWKTILKIFISDNVGDIQGNVIEPALRDLAYNIITKIIYGDERRTGSGQSQQYYRDYSTRQDFRSKSNAAAMPSRRKYSITDYKYASVETAREAEKAVKDIKERANRYGRITIHQFWEIIGVTSPTESDPMEQHWGWYPDMLMGLTWKRNMDGRYSFVMQEPVYFD